METTSLPVSSPYKLITTSAYYFSFLALGLTVGATGPVLPTLAQHTSTTLDRISLIFITLAFGYILGTLIGGWAYDRFPAHRMLAAALIISSVALFLIPIISDLALLVVAMALLGFCQGCIDVGGNLLLIWLHGSKVAPFMNGLHFFYGFGAFVAPVIVAQITAASGNIYWVYWLFAILNLPIAVWTFALPSPAIDMNGVSSASTRARASTMVLGLIMAFFFLTVGLEIGYGNWIYTYATTLGLADAAQAAYLTSAYWGALTLFRLVGVWLSARFSPQNILIGNFAGCAVALGIISALPGSQLALWGGTIILGASISSIFPTMLNLAEQRLHLTGSVTRWFFIGSGIGQMVLPWLIGQLFVALGALSMMVCLMIDLVLNVLVFAWVLGKSRRTISAEMAA